MNVKPGDLARIVGVRRHPLSANNDRIVEVLRASELWGCWVVRSVGPLMAEDALGHFFEVPPGYEGDCEDRVLRPIGGVPVPEDIPTEEPVNA